MVDGRAVATGLIELFEVDNLDKAFISVAVLPTARNHGHGSQMLDVVMTRAREDDRTTLLAEVDYPFDADDAHPHRRFMTRRGFSLSQANVHRVLDLPPDEALLDRLARRGGSRTTATTRPPPSSASRPRSFGRTTASSSTTSSPTPLR